MNYKVLFGDEICKCGKRGVYIISNGSGKVKGFICEECKNKKKLDNSATKIK